MGPYGNAKANYNLLATNKKKWIKLLDSSYSIFTVRARGATMILFDIGVRT